MPDKTKPSSRKTRSSAQENEAYWAQRYNNRHTGWDIGYASPPITNYFDQVADTAARILIPGAGNAYEAEYLFRNGFRNVYVLDIARPPLDALQARVPEFPEEQLLHTDFFVHEGQYDYVVEQTFFCSFPPDPANRQAYALHVHDLLAPGGKLVGLWFDVQQIGAPNSPPYGGSKAEYLTYFEPWFECLTFEPCYNSIKPRQGSELFGIWKKKPDSTLVR